MKKYELIDHTADLGIEIYGRDEKELFSNAGYALFDLFTDLTRVRKKISRHILVKGIDRADLMINWLRELLSLFNSERYLFKQFVIEQIGKYFLSARLEGEEFCPGQHPIEYEIKAVTYHQAEVTRKEEGWISRVIFDI